MAEATGVAPEGLREQPRSVRTVVSSAELDMRFVGLLGALLVIWVAFHIMSGGTFLTPRNLWNLSVQTASVAIMATGMVLIIVSRNIDLSVGSMLGFVAVTMGMLQAEWIPETLGLGFDQPYTWLIALGVGILLGTAIGAFQGFIVAYIGVPSFIVTLGGLLVWRGLAWSLNAGQTVAPMDSNFQLLGGGARGSLGDVYSWVVGVIACVAIVAILLLGRRQRRKYEFQMRPLAMEIALGLAACVIVLGAVFVANSYFLPENVARQIATERGIAVPPTGLQIPYGIANPVLIAIAVTIVMTIVAKRLRFGRYVFAIGGNPEAAELGGINTRRIIMGTFALMGTLAAISAAISAARLNAATNGMGTLAELYVIAAAVIGGTSFAGGIGTVAGAVLGAVVMQSLQSGMVLMRVEAPIQDIVVGIVLVIAVGIDTIVRRRTA